MCLVYSSCLWQFLVFFFSFAIMLLRKRELVALISALFILWGCDRFLCLFLAVSRVGLATMFEHFLVKQTVHNYLIYDKLIIKVTYSVYGA